MVSDCSSCIGRVSMSLLQGLLVEQRHGRYNKKGNEGSLRIGAVRAIFSSSAQAGLRVERISRWHFGTTYICICRPASSP